MSTRAPTPTNHATGSPSYECTRTRPHTAAPGPDKVTARSKKIGLILGASTHARRSRTGNQPQQRRATNQVAANAHSKRRNGTTIAGRAPLPPHQPPHRCATRGRCHHPLAAWPSRWCTPTARSDRPLRPPATPTPTSASRPSRPAAPTTTTASPTTQGPRSRHRIRSTSRPSRADAGWSTASAPPPAC
ncbi:hypothetical protein BU14_0031s0090 [Porphyra umbilicalis]|uniref:Uncharacterized protein n=1 Tax=Porphyra umbilicalis TaxID=2786 RepID=A0A1X6PJA8_PORUM|nr:hypothetical protein BU14_0031s0090 [Porphyra umbilicalis]|eukprot:OSX80920.1 hypothetical protein BU14_0031s0090 [Porphyra umbilicalis]